jgi:hypothetical protein
MPKQITFDIDKPCTYCEGVADFVMIDGAWYVCADCIKDGETDTQAEVGESNG